MRLFIGIKLDENAIKKVNNYYKYFYSEKVTGNFTNLSNLHLTLAFLGEVDDKKVNEIIDAINSLMYKIDSLKIFKFTKLKDMLIGKVEKEGKLIKLQQELNEKLKEMGFKVNDLNFYPHITLIREVKGLEKVKIIDSNIEIISKESKVTLFESKRINGKLTYIRLN